MHEHSRGSFLRDDETMEFCPVILVSDSKVPPAPKVFLENSTRRFVYVLQEIKEKPDA